MPVLLRVLIAVGLAVMASRLPAANYYVAPEGNDLNPGTSSDRPFKYIQSAILKTAPGDTIYLMPGKHTLRPGDKNMGFKERGGKPGQPITVTTTGPGVVIDLTDAVRGWGGFRIGNDAEWIVIDGGGNPNPFDEKSYHLVIQNANYAGNEGDDRSNSNCRPITVQSSQHIILRNICGKRSMGSIGVFGAVKDMLIENCRCVPGEKLKDPGASHGIYVGSGADDVIIRHCYIQWGGDGRLGLQNNGGGKNVLLDDCFITECAAAIKSFNGGHVTAKNCHFWNIVESNPMQGDVTAEGIILTAPTPAEMIPMKPLKASAKPGVATEPPTPRAPPKPPTEARLQEIAATRARASVLILRLLKATKTVDVVLPYKDQYQEIRLTGGSPELGLEGKLNGAKLALAWNELSASHMAGVLEVLAGESPTDPGPVFATMAVLYAIDEASIPAATMSTKALDADPDQEAPLKTALANLK